MNFQNTIADIKTLSGMRNKDIVDYIEGLCIQCSPSQITKLANGSQVNVDYELGAVLKALHTSVRETYWGVRDLEMYGANFDIPRKEK